MDVLLIEINIILFRVSRVFNIMLKSNIFLYFMDVFFFNKFDLFFMYNFFFCSKMLLN